MRPARWVLSVLVIASSTAAIAVAAAKVTGGPPVASPVRERVPGDWLGAVRESITLAEYQVSWQEDTALPRGGGALQAPNRAHGLRTYFTPWGVKVAPRTEPVPSWTWGLRLAGYGPSDPVARGNRVEYRRGPLTEWYVNDPKGLEQGFTFTTPPPELSPGRGELILDLELWGSLLPDLSPDGRSIRFTTPSGDPVLTYAGLAAWDSTGRDLRAALDLLPSSGTPGMVRITVDATGATYPVTIDPVTSGPDWSGESDWPVSWYGYATNSAGDVNADGYDDLIIGAHRYDTGFDNDGKAFIYYGSPTGPSTTADWTVVGDWTGAKLGHSVGGAGDVNADGYDDVIIGVPNPTGTDMHGWAYAYYGSPDGPSTTPDWKVEGAQAQGWFGRTVRPAGDVNGDGYDDAVVGAPHWDNDQTDEGRAHLYYGSAAGLSTTPAWIGEGNQNGVLFGRWCGTAGDVNGDGFADLLVGAHFYDDDQRDEGRAFVFHGSPSGLSATADWIADGNQNAAWFARAVSSAGDVNGDGYSDVIVGAPKFDNDQLNEGRAFAYYGSPSGLSTTPDWTAEADQAEAWFGRRLGGGGDVNGDGYDDVVVAAPNYDNSGQIDAGRTYAYYGSPGGLNARPNWSAKQNQARAWFGRSVNSAGDVNGDGYADVVIGAPLYDGGEADEGKAWVFFGSANGLGPR
jgi:hypothetical protein